MMREKTSVPTTNAHFEVPLRINFGNESHLDKVGMTATSFWAELGRNPLHP